MHWLRRVRGFEAEQLASNPDLKTLIESEQVAVHKSNSAALRCTPSTRHLSDRATLRRLSGTPDSLVDLCRKLERYVQIVDPIDHRSGRAKTSALAYKVTYEREAQAGFAKKGVRFDEETREWILYYTDRFGRNVTRKKFPPNQRFTRLEALRAWFARRTVPWDEVAAVLEEGGGAAGVQRLVRRLMSLTRGGRRRLAFYEYVVVAERLQEHGSGVSRWHGWCCCCASSQGVSAAAASTRSPPRVHTCLC